MPIVKLKSLLAAAIVASVSAFSFGGAAHAARAKGISQPLDNRDQAQGLAEQDPVRMHCHTLRVKTVHKKAGDAPGCVILTPYAGQGDSFAPLIVGHPAYLPLLFFR